MSAQMLQACTRPYRGLRVSYQKRVLDPVSHKYLMAFKNVLTRSGVMARASNFTSWEAEADGLKKFERMEGIQEPRW